MFEVKFSVAWQARAIRWRHSFGALSESEYFFVIVVNNAVEKKTPTRMNFAKIGKELGLYMESYWSTQKGLEVRLEKMDKLLCDVYSEVKKMNNRVDTGRD